MGFVENVNKVAQAITTQIITAVESISSNMTDITNVSDNMTDVVNVSNNATVIGTVNSNLNAINDVHTNMADVLGVASDLTAIDTVNNNLTGIHIVSDDLQQIGFNNLFDAGFITDPVTEDPTGVSLINTVVDNITNVNSVGTSITNVNAVAADLTNIDAVATNVIPVISDILLAESYATAAAGSASASAASATASSNSATDASNSALAAAASYDAFDDRYLGAKAVAPTLDNDGNTLLTGALYWDTVNNEMFAWDGVTWSSIASLTNSSTSTLTNKTIDSITNIVGANHIHYPVRNVSGSTISAGTVVTAQATQSGTDYVEVVPVTNAQTQIALGIMHNTVANNGTGLCMNTGVSADMVDTSGWTVGTILYPDNAGGLTSTKPTSGQYQAAAVVLRSHANQGTLLVEFTEPKKIASTTQSGYVQLNNTLTSTSTTQALTAAQGKVLQDGKQPLDATLTALAGVTTAADKVIYATGSDTFSTTAFTTFGRNLVGGADSSAGRTTLQISATNTPFTPTGNLAATNVQSALAELDTEKLDASVYTANDILSKLLTVDGVGSALDADTVQGVYPALTATAYTLVKRNLSGNAVGLGDALGVSFNSMQGLSSTTPLTPTLTGDVGTSTYVARADHIHPANFSITVGDIKMNGTASLGTLDKFPRADHVHPHDNTKADAALLGQANGIATLDATGKVPSTQLPSYVDDVVEYTDLASFPATGETSKIYVALDTGKLYRWSGSAYVYITSGAVDSVGGYTGIVTATDLLTAIKTVDGSDSGLDADTVDGKHVGTSGNTIPLMNGINTWSAKQSFYGNAQALIDVVDNSASSVAPWIRIIGDRNDANGSGSFSGTIALSADRTDSAITAGKVLGRVLFGGTTTPNNKTTDKYAASIVGYADGTFGASTPTGMRFYAGSTPRNPSDANVNVGDTLALEINSSGVSDFKITPTVNGSIIPVLDGTNTWSGIQTFSTLPAFNGGTSGSTAPFTVDSTTVVTNLNADLLDGQQGSYYFPASGFTADAMITLMNADSTWTLDLGTIA